MNFLSIWIYVVVVNKIRNLPLSSFIYLVNDILCQPPVGGRSKNISNFSSDFLHFPPLNFRMLLVVTLTLRTKTLRIPTVTADPCCLSTFPGLCGRTFEIRLLLPNFIHHSLLIRRWNMIPRLTPSPCKFLFSHSQSAIDRLDRRDGAPHHDYDRQTIKVSRT